MENKNNMITISMSELFFDEKVVDMVEKNGVVFPEYLLNNIYEQDTFPLDQTRLDSLLRAKHVPLISVKRGNKFIVLNGRHRICAAIIKQECDIDAEIIE